MKEKFKKKVRESLFWIGVVVFGTVFGVAGILLLIFIFLHGIGLLYI